MNIRIDGQAKSPTDRVCSSHPRSSVLLFLLEERFGGQHLLEKFFPAGVISGPGVGETTWMTKTYCAASPVRL